MLFLLILFLFPSLSFGATLKDELLVWSAVEPDTYSLSITVKVKAPREEGVLKALKTVDDFLRRTGLPYKGGNFGVWPKREWNQEKREYEFKGFVGTASYTFYLSSPSLQLEVFKALRDAKEHADFIYEVNRVGWELSYGKKQEVLASLKLKALKEAKREAREFGALLGQKCKISEVDFSNSPFPVYRVLTKGIGAPLPSRESKRIEVRALLKLNCE